MQTADGIETILHGNDPVERRLALKSAAVQPSHLRQALADEDPLVRAAAAKHPALTPELIRQVFEGHDDWLKHIVLERADLRPEDLEALVTDPGFSTELANHPALTPEQAERLSGLPSTPEAFKEELMRKNIGFITYPGLGEGKLHQTGGYYPERGFEAHSEALGVPAPKRPELKFGELPSAAVAAGGREKTHGQAVYSRLNGEAQLPEDQRRTAIMIASGKERFHPRTDPNVRNKALAATEAHEVQHGVFARLAQRYGNTGRNKILNSTLDHLPYEHRSVLAKLFEHYQYPYHPDHHAEEAIAHLHNYLQDPEWRQKTHVMLRIKSKPDVQKELHSKAKKAWHALVRVGKGLTPKDVGLDDRTDAQLVKNWVDRLAKSSEADPQSLEDHLGFDGRLEAVQTAVRFMTGQPLDLAIFRARLHDTDGDYVAAGLAAANLPESDYDTLKGIMSLKALEKAQPDQKHTVEALLPEADEVAQALIQAFESNEVEPVALGGKHSKGTMMAKDPDGHLLLIKPGSGKQSPAAGAAQEKASQSRREAAFSAVARVWGMAKYVPKADLVRVDGQESAVFRMLGLDWSGLHRAKALNPGLPRQVLRRYLNDGTLHKWAVMDWVLGQTDRHGNNLMVGPGPDHDVALIDHGSSFAGSEFAPGRDQNSFIPYYLRIWGPGTGWSKMSVAEKSQAMPTVSPQIEGGLRYWVANLDPVSLSNILYRHGIDPEPSLARLRTMKSVVAKEQPSAGINRLWLG